MKCGRSAPAAPAPRPRSAGPGTGRARPARAGRRPSWRPPARPGPGPPAGRGDPGTVPTTPVLDGQGRDDRPAHAAVGRRREAGGRSSAVRPPAPARRATAWSAWWRRPRPRRAARSVSVSASAGAPSRLRRWRPDLPAEVPVSPARSAGVASEAVCRVSNVTRSADVAKRRRDRTRPTTQTDSSRTSSSATTSHAVRTPEWSRSAPPDGNGRATLDTHDRSTRDRVSPPAGSPRRRSPRTA